MKYLITCHIHNPELQFVSGLQLFVSVERLIKITLSAAKLSADLDWEYPPFSIERCERSIIITFDRANNWNEFQVEMLSTENSAIFGTLIYLEPILEPEIAASQLPNNSLNYSGRIRLIGTTANNGIGTHVRNLLPYLKSKPESKNTIEFIERYDNEKVQETINNSTRYDYNIFFQNEVSAPLYQGLNIIWFVFELTKIEKKFLTSIVSTYQEIWVPSEWGKQILLQHSVPYSMIRVMPEGVNPNVYFPKPSIPQIPSRPFRIVQVGKYESRKSYKESIAAINLAFGGQNDVELHVKCDWISESGSTIHPQSVLDLQACQVPTVNYVGNVNEIEMVNMYHSADLFLFPSKGEGWGLPLIEAIACGIPCITTCYSGQSEFLNHLEGLFLSVDFHLARMDCLESQLRSPNEDSDWGLWACPDVNDFALKLKDSKDNIIKWKQSALIASDIVRKLFSWQACANRVHTAIEQLQSTRT